jgi:hypothetical protein
MAEKSLCVRGRHVILTYLFYEVARFNVFHMDTGAVVCKREVKLSWYQEKIASTQDSTFVFVKDGKYLHRFDTATFEVASFDLSLFAPGLDSSTMGVDHTPTFLLPISGTRVAIVARAHYPNSKLYCVDLESTKLVWDALFEANCVSLSRWIVFLSTIWLTLVQKVPISYWEFGRSMSTVVIDHWCRRRPSICLS